jgi:hypothetical protein
MRFLLTCLSIASAVVLQSSGPLHARSTTAQEPDADRDAIRRVLTAYVEGWRDGDVARLGTALAPNGQIMWPANGRGLTTMTFEAALERRRPQPEYGRTWEVQSLDVVDARLAVAKLSISREGGSYVDYLVLMKLDAGWRIVNKTFVTR